MPVLVEWEKVEEGRPYTHSGADCTYLPLRSNSSLVYIIFRTRMQIFVIPPHTLQVARGHASF